MKKKKLENKLSRTRKKLVKVKEELRELKSRRGTERPLKSKDGIEVIPALEIVPEADGKPAAIKKSKAKAA